MFEAPIITFVGRSIEDTALQKEYNNSISILSQKKHSIIVNFVWEYFGTVLLQSDDKLKAIFVVILPRIFDSDEYKGNKNQSISLKENIHLVARLWRLIKKYTQDLSKQSWKTPEDFISIPELQEAYNSSSIDAILAAFNLWQDYQEHQKIVFTDRYVSPQGKGRIGWQKSIVYGEPIHTSTGEIYRDLYRTVVRVDPYHELAMLHAHVCNWIGQNIFGEEVDEIIDLDEPYPEDTIDLLEKYENQLYQDRHLEVYENLVVWCRFLSSTYMTAAQTNESMNGTFILFQTLWEWLLKETLEISPPSSSSVPILKGQYWLLNNQITSGLSPRLDLIVDYDQKLLILDAKDFKIRLLAESTPPRSKDIYKQIVYRLAWKKWAEVNNRKIYNAFLFPYDLSQYQSEIIYYGAHVSESFEPTQSLQEETDFDFTIHCFLIDFLSLIDIVLDDSKDFKKLDEISHILNYFDQHNNPIKSLVVQAHNLSTKLHY